MNKPRKAQNYDFLPANFYYFSVVLYNNIKQSYLTILQEITIFLYVSLSRSLCLDFF